MAYTAAQTLPGTLVVSLDFELHWGVRDHQPAGSPYDAALHGARTVVPRLLDLFRAYDVAATWATVGFLFARSREDRTRFDPAKRPSYQDERLDPYGEAVGKAEQDDPLHYAPSLIEAIRQTPRQEVATHTYAHYYCGEPGQTAETFAADLQAARAIAEEQGIALRSIVFPRNQHNPAYDDLLREAGITAYRGNPPSWMWRFENTADGSSLVKRVGRMLDTYVNVAGHNLVPWSNVLQPGGLADVRASALLRPYTPRLRALEPLRLRRIRQSMEAAAQQGALYHLWWHPHNFGLHPEENLAFLQQVLDTYAACRDRYGMQSLTMAEVAERVRGDSA